MKVDGRFSAQKVLVTGASGFIGSHLCRSLTNQGAEVYALSRAFRKDDMANLHWIQVDLEDATSLRDLVRTLHPNVVIHLAGQAVGVRDLEFVLPIFRSNLLTTINLLTAAAETGCQRIVVAGSLEEPDQHDPQPTPSSPYAASKWASSTYARMFHALYHTPVAIARLFMTYGPGQQDIQKLVPYTILSLLQGKAPKLTSGNRLVDWIYVEDVVEGLLAAALATDLDGSTVELGSGRLTSIRSVVEKIERLVGSNAKPIFGALPDRAMEQTRMADTNNTHAKLRWKPITSLDEGLKRTVEWYKQHLSTGTMKFDPDRSKMK
jgi:UDP-glucose 4-epimerase